MAKFQFKGVDDYIAQLEDIYGDTDEIIGRAIYEGAAVVMNEVRRNIENLQTDERFGTTENPTMGPKAVQKYWLLRSVGISDMRQDGTFWNVKIGFDGYNGIKTITWPNGQPNAMVARSVESGTSFMRKQPFIRPAEHNTWVKCERAMANTIDKEITQRVKETKS